MVLGIDIDKLLAGMEESSRRMEIVAEKMDASSKRAERAADKMLEAAEIQAEVMRESSGD